MHFNSEAKITNDSDYSFHIKAAELYNQSYRLHVTPYRTTSY